MNTSDAFYAYVGSAIQEARVSAQMTQSDLAKAVSLTRTSITNIEAGRQRMLIHQLFDIAKAVRAEREALKQLYGRIHTLETCLKDLDYHDEDPSDPVRIEEAAKQAARQAKVAAREPIQEEK